jgi:hypothetical protein
MKREETKRKKTRQKGGEIRKILDSRFSRTVTMKITVFTGFYAVSPGRLLCMLRENVLSYLEVEDSNLNMTTTF